MLFALKEGIAEKSRTLIVERSTFRRKESLVACNTPVLRRFAAPFSLKNSFSRLPCKFKIGIFVPVKASRANEYFVYSERV